jgi:hypothetical protein
MRLSPTLNQYQTKLVVAMAHRKSVKPSTLIKEGIAKLMETLSEKDREILLSHYERMSELERKHPDR